MGMQTYCVGCIKHEAPSLCVKLSTLVTIRTLTIYDPFKGNILIIGYYSLKSLTAVYFWFSLLNFSHQTYSDSFIFLFNFFLLINSTLDISPIILIFFKKNNPKVIFNWSAPWEIKFPVVQWSRENFHKEENKKFWNTASPWYGRLFTSYRNSQWLCDWFLLGRSPVPQVVWNSLSIISFGALDSSAISSVEEGCSWMILTFPSLTSSEWMELDVAYCWSCPSV